MVYRLETSKSQAFFYSMGLDDNTIVEWKVDFLMEEEEESVQIRNIKDEENSIKEILLLELRYYHFNQENIPSRGFKDSLTFFRGTKDKQLNKYLHA